METILKKLSMVVSLEAKQVVGYNCFMLEVLFNTREGVFYHI